MRMVRFTFLLLLLVAQPIAAQHYSEGVCLLLQQQIDRFASQPRNSNYRSAKREFDKYCRNPASAVQQIVSPAAQPRNIAATEPAISQQNATDAVSAAASQNAAIQNKTSVVATVPKETVVSPVSTAELKHELSEAVTAAIKITSGVNAAPLIPAQRTDDTVMPDDITIQILTMLPLIAANVVALLLAVFLLTSWLGYNLPGFKGVFAEYKLNRLLRWRLSGRYLHFRKLKLFTAKGELTVIDHLVLSPFGIFVIMVNGYRGRIFGTESQANWIRQYFGNTRQFMNPLHQNFKNTEAVKHVLQLRNTEYLHSVVAFSRVAHIETDLPAYITYVDNTAAYLKQFTEPCISDEQLCHYAAVLSQTPTER